MAVHAIDDLRELDRKVSGAREWLSDPENRLVLVMSGAGETDQCDMHLATHAVRDLHLTKAIESAFQTEVKTFMAQLEERLRVAFETAAEGIRADLVKRATAEAQSVLRELGARP